MPNIKAIIADVDGVMVGKDEGVNFPLPHTEVINALRRIAEGGTPIVLCTAKFRAGLDDLVTKAHLVNPHITDGGALIVNPLGQDKIVEQNSLDAKIVQDYLAHDTDADTITELYSPTDYFVQKSSDQKVIGKHAKILQKEPIVVDDLAEVARSEPIIKVISFTKNDVAKAKVEKQVERLSGQVNAIWTHHPFITSPLCVITAPGVSKEHAAVTVANRLGIPLAGVLGVGDSPSDWSFMKLCGYVGSVGENQELRELVKSKDSGHYFMAPSVDDHGLLAIFEHFGLT